MGDLGLPKKFAYFSGIFNPVLAMAQEVEVNLTNGTKKAKIKLKGFIQLSYSIENSK